MKPVLPMPLSRVVLAMVGFVFLALEPGCVAGSQGPGGPGLANPGAGDDDGGFDEDSEPAPELPPCSSWLPAEAVGTVEDGNLDEISGIAASLRHPELLWVIEDSGAANEVVALNYRGATMGTLRLDGAHNVDWEDIALGPCGADHCLWVGDIGDNLAARDDLSLIRIIEPAPGDLDPKQQTVVQADVFPFSYAEGPQDAEALLVGADGLPAVLTKRTDGEARVYAFSNLQVGEHSSPALLGTVPTAAATGLAFAATAADLSVDGERLLIRTYAGIREYALAWGGLAAAASAVDSVLPAALEPQGEAVAYDEAGRRVWQVSEGVNPSLFALRCQD